MGQRDRLNLIRLVSLVSVLLLLAFFATGCSETVLSGVSSISKTISPTSTDTTLRKAEVRKWQDRLPIEVISIFPNEGRLARVYGKIENRGDQQLESVRISIMDAEEQGELAATYVSDLKPGEAKTFEAQTAVAINKAGDAIAKISGVQAKKKP